MSSRPQHGESLPKIQKEQSQKGSGYVSEYVKQGELPLRTKKPNVSALGNFFKPASVRTSSSSISNYVGALPPSSNQSTVGSEKRDYSFS